MYVFLDCSKSIEQSSRSVLVSMLLQQVLQPTCEKLIIQSLSNYTDFLIEGLDSTDAQ